MARTQESRVGGDARRPWQCNEGSKRRLIQNNSLTPEDATPGTAATPAASTTPAPEGSGRRGRRRRAYIASAASSKCRPSRSSDPTPFQ